MIKAYYVTLTRSGNPTLSHALVSTEQLETGVQVGKIWHPGYTLETDRAKAQILLRSISDEIGVPYDARTNILDQVQ